MRNEKQRSNSSEDWSERAKAWVESACAEQGVPVKIKDPLVLARVAEILEQGRAQAAARRAP